MNYDSLEVRSRCLLINLTMSELSKLSINYECKIFQNSDINQIFFTRREIKIK